MIAGLVLAAGASTRFGAPKQLALLDGRPLLEHAVSAMTAAPLDEVVVVLGARAKEVRAAVDLGAARVVEADDWASGQSASLRAGLATLHGADAVVIALGDQPFLSPRSVEALIGARGNGAQAVRATYAGIPGHPILIERALLPAIRRLTGDTGARSILGAAAAAVREVACDGLGRPDDIDTPAELRDAGGAVDATPPTPAGGPPAADSG